MEDTLRETTELMATLTRASLNPCFNGRYSQSMLISEGIDYIKVLILVLMEDTLREQDIRILCISKIGIYKTNNACPCQQKLTAF